MQKAKTTSTNQLIKGSLKGIENLVYEVARSRTRDAVRGALAKIYMLNKSAYDYVLERVEYIAAFYFLKEGKSRGGRITDQMVESFNHLVVPMRQLAPISAIQWLNTWMQVKWQKHEAICLKRKNGDAELKSITPNAAESFEEMVLNNDATYEVEFLAAGLNYLKGKVTKTKNGKETVEVVWIIRYENGVVTCVCPCKMREEYGYCCGRLVALMWKGSKITNIPGMKEAWDFRKKEFFAPFMHLDEWEKQLAIKTTPLPTLPIFENPASDKDLLARAIAVGIKNVPLPIVGLAGRPKNKQKKRVRDNQPRKKPSTEKKTKKGRPVKKTKKVKDNEDQKEQNLRKIGQTFLFLFFFFFFFKNRCV
jgi:hypothetical protein